MCACVRVPDLARGNAPAAPSAARSTASNSSSVDVSGASPVLAPAPLPPALRPPPPPPVPRHRLRLALTRSLSEPGPPGSALPLSPLPLPLSPLSEPLFQAPSSPPKRRKLADTPVEASPTPCSHAAGRAALLQKVSALDADDLAERLSATVLLDCRAFLAFNASHIRGAVNVQCGDRLTRRRLAGAARQAFAAIAAATASAKDAAEAGRRLVVVYDEASSALDCLPANHPLVLVLAALVADGRDAAFLIGESLSCQLFSAPVCSAANTLEFTSFHCRVCLLGSARPGPARRDPARPARAHCVQLLCTLCHCSDTAPPPRKRERVQSSS